MKHHYLATTPADTSGDHWAVSAAEATDGQAAGSILVQLQENGEQVRVKLTPAQAIEMGETLLKAAAYAQ